MLHIRWTLLEMRKDAFQRDLPAPDEAYAKHHYLHQGVERLVDKLYLSLTRCISVTPLPCRPLAEEIALSYPEDCRDPLSKGTWDVS
jgi:hypothetical protein